VNCPGRGRRLQVFPSELDQHRFSFDQREFTRHAGRMQRERDRSHARAQIHREFRAPASGREGREQERVGVHAIAVAGLEQRERATEQHVRGERLAHRVAAA